MNTMIQQFLPMFFVTLVVFALFFLFMGIGYLVKKKPLKGSCGGVATLMGDEYCQFCGNDPNKCESQIANAAKVSKKAASLAKKA
ncbi:(Na+)-NQR maturation NqrM [Moraxella nasovis]|uniref:(Na+)-NQR maturation NqrM n=1 Tax=Moraxella nasovis TaxID=2904121 RepID=UPI001F60A92D|nr:(Na+)-NQR maturation NqrM [Moraxella nasovis]UNU74221.1 (Na+)-NQR maturation NqrM [Moraxella nasovis]